MTHIIRHQYLQVELIGTEAEGLALQNQLARLSNDWLLPALEQVLNRFAPADGHLYIEHLDIEAGALLLNRLEQDLPEVVAQAMEKAIREKISLNQAAASAKDVTTENKHFKTESQAQIEALLYFLNTGRLPWSFQLPDNMNLEQMLLKNWQNKALEIKPTFSDFSALSKLLTSSATARQRLLWQFSDAFLNTVLGQLAPQVQQALQLILQKLQSSAIQAQDKALLKEKLWQTAFAKITSEYYKEAPNLLTDTLQVISGSINQARFNLLLEQIITVWPELNLKKIRFSNQAFSPVKERKEDPHLNKSELPADTSENNQGVQTNTMPEPDEGIYIDNAGLVLLHPFLPMLFEALHICSNDKIVQPSRALCLLHFLATGNTSAPEYELTLAKLLCNMPEDMPVRSDVVLTEEEQNEATALLQAVIRHWEALKNTSPDGLRSTFLLRSGKLSIRDDGDWLLQVEPKTYDILLDQLSWGISAVKLPWMERLLWVEWR